MMEMEKVLKVLTWWPCKLVRWERFIIYWCRIINFWVGEDIDSLYAV
jgi:hypothetical protein